MRRTTGTSPAFILGSRLRHPTDGALVIAEHGDPFFIIEATLHPDEVNALDRVDRPREEDDEGRGDMQEITMLYGAKLSTKPLEEQSRQRRKD